MLGFFPIGGAPIGDSGAPGVVTLGATGLTTGGLTLGTPAITQVQAVTATGLTTATPTLGTPTLTQVQSLAGTNLATGGLTLATPAVTQAQSLTAVSLTTGGLTFGTPALLIISLLNATSLATGGLTLGTPVLTQLHLISAANLSTGPPTLGTPVLTQVQALVAVGLVPTALTRTNLQVWSEQIDTYGGKINATVTANAALAPNNTLTADKLVEDTTVSQAHRIGGVTTGVMTIGNTYTWSWHVKTAGRRYFWIQLNGNPYAKTYFDLTGGSVSATGSGHTAVMTSLPDGWYRCSVTAVIDSTGGSNLCVGMAAVSGSEGYTGDGVSGVYLWGDQLEAGSVTAYIGPTSGVGITVNISADTPTLTQVQALTATGLTTAAPIIGSIGVAALNLDFTTGLYQLGGATSGLYTSVAGVTYTRSGVEYAADSAGVLHSFAANVPAITDLGLQDWEARTNYVTYSQDMSNAAWATDGFVSITANAATAPDGTSTANKVDETTNSSNHGRYRNNLTLSAGSITWTWFAKAAERSIAGVDAYADSGSHFTFFSLSGAGSVLTNASGNTSSILALANGWYQIAITRTVVGGGGIATNISPIATDGVRSYAGTTGYGIYAWQADVQQGAVAGPPIYTTSAAATRGAAFSKIANLTLPATGTVITGFSVAAPNTNGARGYPFMASDSGVTRFVIRGADTAAGAIPNAVIGDGTSNSNFGSGILAANTTTTVVLAYDTTSARGGFADLGSDSGDFAVQAVAATITNATFGIGNSPTGGGNLNGFLKSVTVVPNYLLATRRKFYSNTPVSPALAALGPLDLTQVHNLTAAAPTTGGLTLGTPVLTQVQAVTATGLTTGSPTLGTPVLTQVQSLVATSLVMPGRTNLHLYSQAFSTSPNSVVGVTATTGQVASDGSSTATLLTEDGTTAYHSWNSSVSGALINGASYTGSVEVKPNGRNKYRLHLYTNTYIADATFDLTGSGTVHLASYGSATVTALLGGWYRITVTGTAASTAALSELNGNTLDGTYTNSYTGDSASGVYLRGAQFELGAAATQYIPTTTTAVTVGLTLGTPVLTQVHNLTATGLTTGSPTLGTPTVTQVQSLTATALTTASPTLGTPALVVSFHLTATGLTTGSPTLGTPVLTQVQALNATNLTTAGLTLGTPVLTQVQSLVGVALATANPTFSTPVLTQVHILATSGVTTGGLTLGTPTVTQVQILVATPLTVGGLTLGAPTLTQVQSLVATNLLTGGLSLGAPALTQLQFLFAANLSTGPPTFAVPAVTQSQLLVADSFTTYGPGFDLPILTQVQALVAVGLPTGALVIDRPVLTQLQFLVAVSLATGGLTLPTPVLTQVQGLVSIPLTTTGLTFGTPTITQVHHLVTVGIATGHLIFDTPYLSSRFNNRLRNSYVTFVSALRVSLWEPL